MAVDAGAGERADQEIVRRVFLGPLACEGDVALKGAEIGVNQRVIRWPSLGLQIIGGVFHIIFMLFPRNGEPDDKSFDPSSIVLRLRTGTRKNVIDLT